MKIDDLLNETWSRNTKKMANELDTHLNNIIIKTIDNWVKKNLDRYEYAWDYPEQKDEVFKKVAEGQINFFKGMLNASDKALKRKR